MNKKGFTLVELLGVVVLLAIVSGLAVISTSHITSTGKKGVYKNYEKTFEGSVQNYFTDNPNEIPKKNTSKKIYLKDIINDNYLDEIKDPNGGNCNDSSNNSYVLVTRSEDKSYNYNLDYKVCLICISNGNITYKSADDC